VRRGKGPRGGDLEKHRLLMSNALKKKSKLVLKKTKAETKKKKNGSYHAGATKNCVRTRGKQTKTL